MHRSVGSFFYVVLFFFLMACGGEDGEDVNLRPNQGAGDTGSNKTPNNSEPDGGTTVDMGDQNGECTVAVDLGVLGDVAMADAEFEQTTEVGPTSCAAEGVDTEVDGTAIVRFELDAPRRIDVTLDGVPYFSTDEPVIPPQPSWEVRNAPCDTGEVARCSNERQAQLELPVGTYYMVISGRLDSGGFRLEMTSEELVCMPGEMACVADQIERCVRGTAVETYPCFDACTSDDACTGNTCGDVVGVTIEANGAPYTIEGHRRAQTNDWTAQALDGCELFAGDPSPDTPGVDLFVRIDGITAGQTLEIDAERSDGNYAFFIIPDCAATSCLHAGDFNSSGDNATTWTASQNGPVVLVVEALGTSEREIAVDLMITD